MSRLISIDDLLELVSDVTDIDRLVYWVSGDGIVSIQLWCDDLLYSEFMMRAPDFYQVQVILTGTLVVEAFQEGIS